MWCVATTQFSGVRPFYSIHALCGLAARDSHEMELCVISRGLGEIVVRAIFNQCVWIAGAPPPNIEPSLNDRCMAMGGPFGNDVSEWYSIDDVALAICEAALDPDVRWRFADEAAKDKIAREEAAAKQRARPLAALAQFERTR